MIKFEKKIILLVLCMLFFLAGCGSNREEKTYDEAFLKDFKSGLTARWDIKQGVGEEESKYLGKLVDAELNKVSKYTDLKFEVSKLQENAISYINLLKTQKESLSYYTPDYTKFNEMWQDSYKKRSQMLQTMINDYGISFPSKYNDVLDELLTNAKIANDEDEFKKLFDEMISGLNFEKVSSTFGISTSLAQNRKVSKLFKP